MVKIKQNNIWATIEGIEEVHKALEWEQEYYIQGRFKKERKTYKKSVIKNGKVLAGLAPYIKDYCKTNSIECIFESSATPSFKMKALPGITLRPEQIRLVNTALEKHRGILQGFTGVGKSLILTTILNSVDLPGKFLVLVHNKSLVKQLIETFLKFNLDVGIFTGEEKDTNHKIIVGTIQSCVKMKWEGISGIFVDECHHLSGMDTQYVKLLSLIDAPVRLGFSATPKTIKDGEGFFASTGALGPVIDEVDFEEGKDRGLLIPIKLRFVRVPINHELSKITKYIDFVDAGVVSNNRRNKQIINQAKELADQNKSSLIFITKTEHGKILKKMAKDIYDWDIDFVFGKNSTEERDILKNKLKNKDILCIISSVIFTEGINIESLDNIFLGDVGKKESKILQCIGRGLRSYDRKTEVQIWDFLDLSSRFSIKQLGERLLTYSEFNWI